MKERRTTTLNTYEFCVYFCVWTGAIVYGIYQVYLQTSTHFRYYDDIYGDFSPGWKWIGGKRDTADPDWRLWIPFVYRMFPWVVAHLVGGQIVKYYFDSRLLCCWYVLISLTFLLVSMGFWAVMFLLIHTLLPCLVVPIRSRTLLWILHLSLLGSMNAMKTPDCILQKWLGLNAEEYVAFFVGFAWNQLRIICFTSDLMSKYERGNFHGFYKEGIQMLAYCFYLPTMFLGQLIMYSEFVEGINRPFVKWNLKRLAIFLLNLVRYLFWIFFTEFVLHFIHFNVLHFNAELVRSFNSWALYGFGYCMGQYFLNKHVVLYGFSGAIARAENIADLQNPKCIGRIHLYSDMWKYFDRGMYRFLVRYIYIPLTGMGSAVQKVFASFVCFLFIYVWHGTQMYIFIWSMLNFIGVTIEALTKGIGSSQIYAETESKVMVPQNARRFHCILATPLLVMSASSNFYFFGGTEIGNIFIHRIFTESWPSLVTLLSILYCCCQVSTELKIWEIQKSQRSKNK